MGIFFGSWVEVVVDRGFGLDAGSNFELGSSFSRGFVLWGFRGVWMKDDEACGVWMKRLEDFLGR